jgi:hypothetical protein
MTSIHQGWFSQAPPLHLDAVASPGVLGHGQTTPTQLAAEARRSSFVVPFRSRRLARATASPRPLSQLDLAAGRWNWAAGRSTPGR